MQSIHDGSCFEHESSWSSVFPKAPVIVCLFHLHSLITYYYKALGVQRCTWHSQFNFISTNFTECLKWVLPLCEAALTYGNGSNPALIPKGLRTRGGSWIEEETDKQTTVKYVVHPLSGTNEKLGWRDSKGSFQQWLLYDSLISVPCISISFSVKC